MKVGDPPDKSTQDTTDRTGQPAPRSEPTDGSFERFMATFGRAIA